MKENVTIDPKEIAHFSAMADEWWDANGKFKPLHEINPVRLQFIRDNIARHFGRDIKTTQPFSKLSMVDIGSGGGLICEPLCRLGATITGVDASKENIGIASAHAASMGLTIDYQHTTAEALAGLVSSRSCGAQPCAERSAGRSRALGKPLAEDEKGGQQADPALSRERQRTAHASDSMSRSGAKQYDVVLALEIVEHVADVPAFIEAITALVKPGGLIFMSTLNRTAKAYALAIVGAEYLLRWLPRGTHHWHKFLRPSELVLPLEANGIAVQEICGLTFSPITREWTLNPDDLSVNYLLVGTPA